MFADPPYGSRASANVFVSLFNSVIGGCIGSSNGCFAFAASAIDCARLPITGAGTVGAVSIADGGNDLYDSGKHILAGAKHARVILLESFWVLICKQDAHSQIAQHLLATCTMLLGNILYVIANGRQSAELGYTACGDTPTAGVGDVMCVVKQPQPRWRNCDFIPPPSPPQLLR